MQIDLVSELPASSGYQNIVTDMDVLSKYLFDYRTTKQDAKTIARVIINIMTKMRTLPTTTTPGKGPAFASQVINEVADALGVTLEHDTTKHAQMIDMLERTHASLQKALKIETDERRSMWHK